MNSRAHALAVIAIGCSQSDSCRQACRGKRCVARLWCRGIGIQVIATIVTDALALRERATTGQRRAGAAPGNAAGAAIEQTSHGTRPSLELVASFDGLGVGFDGPQGPSNVRNPSDNSLAVGPDHIIQTVNTRLAIFTKKGSRFDTTGRVLYGSVPNNTLFAGFGGACEVRNNGDVVVRYDQLANRWLVVMPIFRRAPSRPDQPAEWRASDTARIAPVGVAAQPGAATRLFVPQRDTTPPGAGRGGRAGQPAPPADTGPFSMCYAVSTSPDPLGTWYRYEFLRPLFPDYPRPAVWPDGYYIPTSTGDDVIQKHACVVDRARMLKGEPATEQCVVIDGVNFLNNADLGWHAPSAARRAEPHARVRRHAAQVRPR
jgi:hypothetical protein